MEFKYRLEGFDTGWTDVGTRRQAFYTNLTARDYRFRVIARSSEGVWNEQGGVLAFTIQPIFYQTAWFRSGCVSALILALLIGWRWKLGHARRQFALILAERVRLSREIHDTLLQSLVGVAVHLTGVASSLDSSSEKGKEQLVKIRRQVEAHIREARESIWDLRSPMLQTADLASALREASERALQGKALQLDWAVRGTPRHCQVKVEQQVLRIALEAINNAVRHARARTVGVELSYQSNSLRLRVSDDGCGFNAGQSAEQAGNGCGLLIMQERTEQVGGRFNLVTRPGSGTVVEIVIPAPSPA